MAEISIGKLRIHQNIIHKLNMLEAEVITLNSDEILKQEKEYQRFINEKLKSAIEWQLRGSKEFSLK